MIQTDRDRRPRSVSLVGEALAPFTMMSTRRAVGALVRALRAPAPIPREGELTEAAEGTKLEPSAWRKR